MELANSVHQEIRWPEYFCRSGRKQSLGIEKPLCISTQGFKEELIIWNLENHSKAESIQVRPLS